jgi:hypothetical protein
MSSLMADDRPVEAAFGANAWGFYGADYTPQKEWVE